MPIEYSIDPARQLVIARGSGVFTPEEVFGYQREVWARPDVAGFNELVDMTDVQKVVATTDNVWKLAELAAEMDVGSPRATKMAIVAPQDEVFGLGRMFDAFRSADTRSTKEVGVFRTVPEAMAFLGLDGEPLAGVVEGRYAQP